ncbi:hypothetical protein MOUN0_K00320 [Monosporozyma unispora]|nr:hypothetical protein C6P44_004106 [Kazachstania unispora]
MLTRGVLSRNTKLYVFRIYARLNGGTSSNIGSIRSIHSKKNTTSSEQVYLYGKSPKEVEKSLQKLNLSQLTVGSQSNLQFISTYLKKLNVMNFKRTTTHLNRFQTELKKNPPQNDIELYKLMIQYLLEESDMEVKRLLQFGPNHLIQSRLNALQESEFVKEQQSEDVETFVMDNIFPSNNINEEYAYLAHLQALFHILNELRTHPDIKWDQYISVDQLVEIFEMSKLIPESQWKDKGIFLSASILYSTKQIRMDPVNESFYINSLIKFGHYKTGFHLFQSNRDNIEEKWWMELGLMLSLVNNNLRTFQKLLHELYEINPNVTLPPKILKLAIRKYSKISSYNNNRLNHLLEKFINNIETYGIKKDRNDKQDKMINFSNEEEASQYLNKIELISYDEIVSVVNSLLYNKCMKLVGPFLDRILSLKDVDPTLWDIIIIKTKLNLLKDFKSIKTLVPKSHLPSSKNKENLQKFEEVFNKTTSKYLNQNDPVINMLLFDNINDLVSDYMLPITIEKILQTLLSSNNDKLEISKFFNVLLKSFLSAGKLEKAQYLLKVMEKMRTDSQFAEANKDKYPSIEIEHYTTMVKYYTSKAIKIHRPKFWKKYQERVIDITNKVNSLNLPYSSSFITRLIIFYRENKDFNRSFMIIEKTLKQTEFLKKSLSDELDQSTASSSLVRQNLYFEIWKVYFQFYKITSLELITAGTQKNLKNWTSFYNTFQKTSLVKPSVELIPLFSTMVQRDNVLPDESFCKLIISTFMKARSWSSIPAVITYFTQIFYIELAPPFISSILTGVRKEFIANETKTILQNDHSLTFSQAKMKALHEAKHFEANKSILALSSNLDMTNALLKNIFLLIKYKNPFDTQFNEVEESYRTLNLMDHYPDTIIRSCK